MPAQTLYTKRELAHYCQVSERTIDRLRAAGKVPAIRVGRAIRFDVADAIAALEAADRPAGEVA